MKSLSPGHATMCVDTGDHRAGVHLSATPIHVSMEPRLSPLNVGPDHAVIQEQVKCH